MGGGAGVGAREVAIVALGHEGDGKTDDGAFVPFTLPGERVRVTDEGARLRLVEVLEPSPGRIAPACRHFGTCGGCALQHMEAGAYRAWKREQVLTALGQRGFKDIAVDDTVPCPPGARRRAVFAATKRGGAVTVGLAERASPAIVDLAECPILRPRIAAALPRLHALFSDLLPDGARAVATVLDSATGLDVAVAFVKARDFNAEQRTHLAAFAAEADFARLSIDGETIVERRAPEVSFGGILVSPPPGGFLQAAEEGETALRARVAEIVAPGKAVADFFAGCGTFALPLARRAPVHAFESELAALDALDKAARTTPGLKPVRVERRDLFRRPVLARDLMRYDAAVLNPPRAGAEAQVAELAKVHIQRLAYVSCNPATFARDARTLTDGGYALRRVTPVDQFLWSPHVELVGEFTKR